MSYSALTGLVYVPATDRKSASNTAVESGEWMHGTEGRLIGWDPVAQSARWSVQEPIATNGGVLSTAGNLVFQGQGSGEFAAYAADSGKKVWSIQTGSANKSIPVTFRIKGEQYICARWDGDGIEIVRACLTWRRPNQNAGPCVPLLSNRATVPFPVLPDVVPPVPKPPQQNASPETIHKVLCFTENLLVMVVTPDTDSGAWCSTRDSRSAPCPAGCPSRLVRRHPGRHALGQREMPGSPILRNSLS
jgi:hypothetical protein